MKLTIEQLQEHMQYLREHIKMFNTTKRADALTTMYDHFEERMMLAPASSMDYFHNCFPGGYIDHVKNITEAGKKLFKLYKEFGFNTLSQFGVTYTEAEYLGLRLADGMYEEGNKYYLMGFGESKKLKTNLPQLVHQADMIATRYEMENYMFSEDANIPYADILGIKLDDVEPRVVDVASGKAIVPSKPVKKSKPKVDKDYKNKLFDELFGDKK